MSFYGISHMFQGRYYLSRVTYASQGLTLVEMVVSIAIGTIAVIVLSAFIMSLYRTNMYAVEQSFAVNSARKGVEEMVRDIRESTYSDQGSFPIISANPYTFYFYSDVDRDTNVERIKYYIENGLLKREVTKAVGQPLMYPNSTDAISIVSDHVRNVTQTEPVFRYYDTAGNEMTDLSRVTDIAFIVIRLVVNINPNRLPNDFVLQSSASLRNLKGE